MIEVREGPAGAGHSRTHTAQGGNAFPYPAAALGLLVGYVVVCAAAGVWKPPELMLAISLWTLGAWMAVAGVVRTRRRRRLACTAAVFGFLLFANAGNLVTIGIYYWPMRR